jgi:general secretion pathway protein D
VKHLAPLILAAALCLGGCANFPAMKLATPSTGGVHPAHGKSALSPPPAPGATANERAASADEIAALTAAPGERIDVELPPQALPQMLNTVFGDILKVPYVLGPDVGARTETITLRGASGMSKRDFVRMVQVALRDYSLKLVLRSGTVNVVDDPTPNISSAAYLGAKPSQDTPQSAQLVTQFYQAKAIDIQALLRLMFDINSGARGLNLSPDIPNNSVVISGRSRDVGAAIDMLHELDQPMFSGVGVVRVEPVYWSAETLGKALEDTLRSEGYGVSGSPQDSRSILVLSFSGANQVLMFAKDPALLARAREWVARLDQPAGIGERPTTFIYQAENTDAKSLADLVETPEQSYGQAGAQPLGLPGTPPAATSAANNGSVGPATVSRGPASNTSSAGGYLGGRIIVDQPGNRILFTGVAEDYTELRKLLLALDTPQKQVLVEVTIAEVTLTDQTNLGVEWFFNHSMSSGLLTGGTLNGLGIGTSGLNLNYTAAWNGLSIQAAFNAFASNNKVNILSRPRLVARSGSEANIQVGTDVPIITSQANSPTQQQGNTQILQTIEYRQTGTILHIKPLIYGDNRVDLVITQEISSEEANSNATVGSPLILERNITTQLSLADGATAVLGGLMDDDYTKGNSGIPGLKDIPILGTATRTDTVSGNKTELIMLVTPYILQEGDDMAHWAGHYTDEMNAAYKVGHGWSYTLTPFGGPPALPTNQP